MFGLLLWLSAATATAGEAAHFVGGQACATCHENQARDWQSSHHAQAMQVATPASVLGDFNGASVTHHGETTSFRRDGDAFIVRTQGPDGAAHDYQVAFTFGVHPLQQYLIAFPDGRVQALGIAWDARAADQGGQRWYHLYSDTTPPPGDRLHWTGRDQTWNHMCATCHSTGLAKNFDPATNRYATTWTDVSVSCEACHGPGSAHLTWAQAASPHQADDHKGLVAWLKATAPITWEMNPQTGIAERRGPPPAAAQLDSCAGCHSRRSIIGPETNPAAPFLDTALPALLDPGLYHADGQFDGEVFEWGSFVQSAMSRAGVTCTNCHEPHSARLRAEGNALCAQCHLPAKFDTAAHHHHPEGQGAQCAACHMPSKTYMGVHVRHDHSLRVPRPDLSVAIGTPNACTQCHTDRPATWAAQVVATWNPAGRQTLPHFATALDAGRRDAGNAGTLLERLAADITQPSIARATAMSMLARAAAPVSVTALGAWLSDPDPLVRMAAIRALPPNPRLPLLELALPLLSDPLRAVRIEAARSLAGIDPQGLLPPAREALERATDALVAAEMLDVDRPETHLNLGLLHARRHAPEAAEAAYLTALRLDPSFVPAMVNLADLRHQLGREPDSMALLQRAVATEPRNADAIHALGLAMVRQRNTASALALLRQASDLAPDNARYAYVYAVALNSLGMPADAYRILQDTSRRHPANQDVLSALVALSQARRDLPATLGHARALAALRPDDQQLRQMIGQLETVLSQPRK